MHAVGSREWLKQRPSPAGCEPYHTREELQRDLPARQMPVYAGRGLMKPLLCAADMQIGM